MFSPSNDLQFALRHNLTELFDDHGVAREISKSYYVDPAETRPYPIEWGDLNRLFGLLRLRRATTVLEFGCGYSTSVMAHALSLNERDFGNDVRNTLRRSNPFELHVVDDMPEYVEITKKRLSDHLEKRCHFHVSDVQMTTFNGRICSEYQTLPNVCPDFIFLDGPGQYSTTGSINGISTRHPDRTPMASDILKIEHFLLPGTMILVDGRTSNARFLKANLQREWRYEHDTESEVHYFEMIEEPLGKWNRRQIEFCLGADWRAKPLKPDYSKLSS